MLKFLDYIESEIKKTEKSFNDFLFWIMTGVNPEDYQFEEEVVNNKKYYGFWKSLYLVIFKKGRIERNEK